MGKLTAALLRKAAKHSALSRRSNALLTEAFNERYGCTYSDVDCDTLIDALDYGLGDGGKHLTVSSCDKAMLICGVSPVTSTQHDGEAL